MTSEGCPKCGDYYVDCKCTEKRAQNRPCFKFDWQKIDEMLEAGCLGTEVAAFFGCHPDTLYKNIEKRYGLVFSDYMSCKRAKGDVAIREAQFRKAVKKLDNTMLIWLGKQRLNQRETPIETEISQETVKKYLEVIAQLSALQQNAIDARSTLLSSPVESTPADTLQV